MRITTRVAIGLFLVAGLLIGTLAYQLSQVEKLQGINREVSLIKMEAARISIRVLQGLEGVREFAAKSALLGDPDYRTQWAEWEEAVEEDLRRLAEVGLSEREEAVRVRMDVGWSRYLGAASVLLEDPAAVLPEVERELMHLRTEAEELIATNEEVVAERAAASALAAEEARLVAWIAAGAALVLAGVLSLLLYLSIAGPLRRLTRGTREVARGRFDHRLEVQGPGELRSLGRDFNHMAEHLGELEVMKQDFVSHVSHELKTPLAAIQETIEILLDQIPGPLTSKQARFLDLSRRSSHRLSGMISNLLEISRLEAGAGTYEPDWCDLTEVARSILEELEPVANERRVETSLRVLAEDPALVCDRDRIGEVIGNLVSNAVKFSPEGGEVLVTLAAVDHPPASATPPTMTADDRGEGPFLLLSVEDEGPGVPDEHKARIFEKFHQVGGRERLPGQGVGLGLAIVARIVEAHGGVIWVEDGGGGGATFRLLLPRIPLPWKERVSPEPPLQSDGPPEVERRPAASGQVATRAALGTLAAVIISGCASLPFSGQAPPDPVPEPEGEASPSYSASASPEEVRSPPTVEASLDRGWSLLAEEAYGEALGQFEQVQGLEEGSSEGKAEALWGTALVHLLSDGPLQDLEKARSSLVVLEEEFGATRFGVQASWIRGLLDELNQVRAVVAEQEDLLRQLSETVELLKQIDLNRRPVRTPQPDSLPFEPLSP